MSVRRETRCLCRDTRYGSTPPQPFFSTAYGARLENLTLAFARRYPTGMEGKSGDGEKL